MRLTIEIVAAALLVVCISATSAAFAAGKAARSADGVSCSFSVAQGASPAARCAAIKRQFGGSIGEAGRRAAKQPAKKWKFGKAGQAAAG